MYVSYVGMTDNAAYSMMQSASSMMSLARTAGSSGANASAIANKEKNLQLNMINQQVAYTATSEMEDSQKKMRDDDIKRTFNMFA